MSEQSERWLDRLRERNDAFQRGIDIARLPVARSPGRFALVTCMDPRINLNAFGIEPFAPDGAGLSEVRVIRTIGGMAEDRSLIVGIHLAAEPPGWPCSDTAAKRPSRTFRPPRQR